MMTASSVEFFPCRVQLMGLPRSAGTTTTAGSGSSATSLQAPPPRRPPMEKVLGVSRNLFGAPEAGEINTMFQQETKRQQSYVCQRYNIDINMLRSSKVQQPTSVESATSTTQPTQLPTLIAHELEQHGQRLQKEECNLNRAAAAEITPPNAKIHQQSCAGVSKIARRCCGDDSLTPSSTHASVERQKPYSRQPSVTEWFNLRKNKICSPSSSSSLLSSPLPSSSSNAETLSLRCSPIEDTHRNVQVLMLPQPMQAEIRGDVIGEVTTNGDAAEDDANDDCSYPRQSTTLSLKLVVSTQNAVATTPSSASRDHA